MGRGGGKDKLAKSGGAILTRRQPALRFAGLNVVSHGHFAPEGIDG